MLKRKMNSARRKPIASILVIVAGLAVTGGGYAAATATTTAKSETYTAAQQDSGRKLFLANCASCHGSNAQGTKAAPSLIGVGAASVAFQVGSGRMPMQASGPQVTDKPPQFTDEQITNLAAWVASLAPGPAIPDEKWLKADGNAQKGGDLFRINCAMCHNAVGAGGALTEGKWAPPLAGADPAEIYEAMITGPQSMPVFSDANLTPQDKSDIITYLVYQRENPSVGGYELANLGPVAEGLFAWVFALGFIIAITLWLARKSN
ncbi:MAG: c-type cytochrome [Actinomycetes bacterium]